MSDEMPESPFSALVASSMEMHELMSSFAQAGFTEEQAFALLQNIISSHIMAQGRQQ